MSNHTYIEQRVQNLRETIWHAQGVIDGCVSQKDISCLADSINAAYSESHRIEPASIEEQFDIKPTYDRIKLSLVYIRNIRNALDRAELKLSNAVKTFNEISNHIEQVPNDEL